MAIDQKALWNALWRHMGNHVEIAVYGNPDNPTDICLEDTDTYEVILDAELYTLLARGPSEPVPGWVERDLTIPSEMLEGASIADLDRIVNASLSPHTRLSSVNVTHMSDDDNETTLHIRAWADDTSLVPEPPRHKYLLVYHEEGVLSPDAITQVFSTREEAAFAAKCQILQSIVDAGNVTVDIDWKCDDDGEPVRTEDGRRVAEEVCVDLGCLEQEPGDAAYDFPNEDNGWHGFNGGGCAGEWQIFEV